MVKRQRLHSNAIYYFDMVCRHMSMREAARRLHVASSAVSRQIIKLEEELGVPLFERLPGKLQLTSAGEIFSRHVRTVLQDADRAYSELDLLQGMYKGHIEIVSVEGPAQGLIPELLARMHQRYPSITVGLSKLGSRDIPEAVISGAADLGVAFGIPETQALQQLSRHRFRLGAIMTPDHPLAGRKEVSLATCAQYPLIMPKPELSIYHSIAPMLGHLTPARAVMESGSVAFSRQMAVRGIGLAFQTTLGIEDDLSSGRLVHVPLSHRQPIISELGIYARAGRLLPVAVDYFARALIDEMIRRGDTDRPN
ncbi:LysR family transcriptional regulator [Rosenbergiella nectarea]|uniref:LysR family transcriptional regulator n=1 Tax=Rosenbergiella nectarea TaxID=988801 RepID=UPI001F4DEBEC